MVLLKVRLKCKQIGLLVSEKSSFLQFLGESMAQQSLYGFIWPLAEFFGLDSKEDLYLPPLKLIANETKLEKLSLSPTEIPATLVGLAR